MADNEAGEGAEGDVPESVPEEQVVEEPPPEEAPPEPPSEEQAAVEQPSEEHAAEESPSGALEAKEPSGVHVAEGTPSGEHVAEGTPSGEHVAEGTPSGEHVVKLEPSPEQLVKESVSGEQAVKESQSGEQTVKGSRSGLRTPKKSRSRVTPRSSTSGVAAVKASRSGGQTLKETPSGVHEAGEPPVEGEEVKASPSGVQTPKQTPSAVEAQKTPSAVEAERTPSAVEAQKTPSAVEAQKTPSGVEAQKTPSGVEAQKTPSGVEAQKTPSGSVVPDVEVIVDKSERQAASSESSEAPSVSVTRVPTSSSSSFHGGEDKLRRPDSVMEVIEKITSGVMEAAGFPARYSEDVSSLPALSVKSGTTASVHFQPQKVALSSSVSDVSGSTSMRLAKQFRPPSVSSRGSKLTGLMSRTVLPGRKVSQESNILVRRLSSERRGSRAGSIMSFRKGTDYYDKVTKAPKFMNTYRLESKRPFVADKVNVILQSVMAQLEEVQYDPTQIPKRCIDMAGEIRSRVKLLGFDRYKIVVVVDIGEKNFQGVCSAFRFLWDCEKDNYTYLTFENMTLYAAASVFAVYYD